MVWLLCMFVSMASSMGVNDCAPCAPTSPAECGCHRRVTTTNLTTSTGMDDLTETRRQALMEDIRRYSFRMRSPSICPWCEDVVIVVEIVFDENQVQTNTTNDEWVAAVNASLGSDALQNVSFTVVVPDSPTPASASTTRPTPPLPNLPPISLEFGFGEHDQPTSTLTAAPAPTPSRPRPNPAPLRFHRRLPVLRRAPRSASEAPIVPVYAPRCGTVHDLSVYLSAPGGDDPSKAHCGLRASGQEASSPRIVDAFVEETLLATTGVLLLRNVTLDLRCRHPIAWSSTHRRAAPSVRPPIRSRTPCASPGMATSRPPRTPSRLAAPSPPPSPPFRGCTVQGQLSWGLEVAFDKIGAWVESFDCAVAGQIAVPAKESFRTNGCAWMWQVRRPWRRPFARTERSLVQQCYNGRTGDGRLTIGSSCPTWPALPTLPLRQGHERSDHHYGFRGDAALRRRPRRPMWSRAPPVGGTSHRWRRGWSPTLCRLRRPFWAVMRILEWCDSSFRVKS